MTRAKERTDDPFRIPVHVDPATGARTWKLWSYVTESGLLLGFAATEAGAFSISTRLAGAAKELLVTEVLP